MTQRRHPEDDLTIRIPADWSPATADAIIRFLSDASNAILDLYGEALMEAEYRDPPETAAEQDPC